jgi:alpha-amylase
MIRAFKQRGTGIIEDVVINHKSGNTSWCDFPDEEKNGYKLTWDNENFSAICYTDECNSAANLSRWSKNGKPTTGAKDTGINFDGSRDLDHMNSIVQQNVKTYLSFLLNDLGYTGFRYDMVAGYGAKYLGEYNATVQPAFSVGEYWYEGGKSAIVNWINGTKVNGAIQSAAFDFPLKWNINSAFGSGFWRALCDAALANDKTYQRYAVTFIDNHDTYHDNNRLKSNVCAANAYILAMPGTPCLFLKHWMLHKGTLKRLITLRRAAGINNQSEILTASTYGQGLILEVQGAKGKLRLHLGNLGEISFANPVDQWKLAIEGKNYQVYASKDVDLTAMQAITEEDEQSEDATSVVVPAFCQVSEGETCAFFEAPKSWGSPIKCWRWDKQYNYTTNKWPGVNCEKVGETDKGYSVWKWTLNAADKKSQSSPNEGIIFNDGSNQTGDLPFTNGGYYNEEGLQATVTVTGVKATKARIQPAVTYDLQGRKMKADRSLPKGIYVRNGRKVVVQ